MQYILKSSIFQIICNSAKKAIEENLDNIIASFKKMKINLRDALKSYLSEVSGGGFQNEINNIFQSSTPSMYIENLMKKSQKIPKFEIGKISLKKC